MKRLMVPACLLMCGVADPAVAQPWQADVLALHNQERAKWRVAPLAWDLGLAASADQWANNLVRGNRWQHSPAELRRSQGENLWMGTTGAYSVKAMAADWLSERRWFRPGLFPDVSSTGRWSDVGHYSQMIASGTTRVGCAIRSNQRWTYLVCRYGPSGNVTGRAMP